MRDKFLSMINFLLLPAVVIVLLVGCVAEDKSGQWKAINESLERANNIINEDIAVGYENLLKLKKNPQTSADAEVWFAKAKQVQQYADSVRMMIEAIKNQLIIQSDSLKREYVTVVKQLYDANGIGGQMLKKLTAFKESISAVIFGEDHVVSAYDRNLYASMPLLPGYRDSLSADEREKYRKRWLSEGFSRSSSLMAMVMLNKIENDVLTTEKLIFDYCDNHIGRGCTLAYLKFQAVACLSSRHVRKGQRINLIAGLGSFSRASKPSIIIDGKEMTLNEDDVAEYKFTVDRSAGKHTIPVRFEYVRPDGSNEIKTQELEYIIADDK